MYGLGICTLTKLAPRPMQNIGCDVYLFVCDLCWKPEKGGLKTSGKDCIDNITNNKPLFLDGFKDFFLFFSALLNQAVVYCGALVFHPML